VTNCRRLQVYDMIGSGTTVANGADVRQKVIRISHNPNVINCGYILGNTNNTIKIATDNKNKLKQNKQVGITLLDSK